MKKVLFVAAVVVALVVLLATPAFAQDSGGPNIDVVVSFLVAAAIPLVAGSRGVTFLVDRVRDALPDNISDNPKYKIAWGALALAFSLVATLGFGVNTIGDLLAQLPQGSDALTGTAGEIITAIVYAGLASSWHDRDVAKNPALTTPTA